MALRKAVQRLTRPVEQIDREELVQFCDVHGFTPLDALQPRTRVATGGEVRSVRIVPRAGAPALEVTVSDGRAAATAVFLGRRKIAGLTPGRKVSLRGMVARDGNQFVIYNPEWSFVA
jgi:hypothetical protein